MKKLFVYKSVLIVVAVLIFQSCAPAEDVVACLEGKTYGFWWGLWHGVISPIAFVISIFDGDTAIYAVNNSGTWYDLGFLIGAGASLGGSSRAI
jgi:hypothetical protein